MKSKRQGPAVIIIAFVAFIWWQQKIKPNVSGGSQVSAVRQEEIVNKAASPKNLDASAKPLESTPVVTNEGEAKEQQDSKNWYESLLAEDSFDIGVCENLGNPTKFAEGKKLKDASKIEYTYEDKDDPIAMAMRLPYRAIEQDPNMLAYGREVEKITEGLSGEARTAKLKEWGSKEKVTAAVEEMKKSSKQYESLADRAIHLAVLAKMVVLKPDLAINPELKSACEKLEHYAGSGSEFSVKKERQQILNLLKSNGLTPEDVHFYPDHYNAFNVDWQERSVHFGFKWKEPEIK